MKKFVMIAMAAMTLTGCAGLQQKLEVVEKATMPKEQILKACALKGEASSTVEKEQVKVMKQCIVEEGGKRDSFRAQIGMPPETNEILAVVEGLEKKKARDDEESRRWAEEDRIMQHKRKQETCIVMTEARWRDKVFAASAAGDRKEVLRLTDPAFKRSVLDYCLKLK